MKAQVRQKGLFTSPFRNFILDTLSGTHGHGKFLRHKWYWGSNPYKYDVVVPSVGLATNKVKLYRQMAENGFAPHPLRNFADISYLVEN